MPQQQRNLRGVPFKQRDPKALIPRPQSCWLSVMMAAQMTALSVALWRVSDNYGFDSIWHENKVTDPSVAIPKQPGRTGLVSELWSENAE